MKNSIIVILIILSCIALFLIITCSGSSAIKNTSITGIYTGKTKDKKTGCALMINKDSTIQLACVSKGDTSEYYGGIKKVNDSLLHISCQEEIFYGLMKGFDDDTLFIHVDSSLVTSLNGFNVIYTNGKSVKISNDKIVDNALKLHVNRVLYNELRGRDYLTISTIFYSRVKNLKKKISLKVTFGSAVSFNSGFKQDFNVVIKNDTLVTVGEPPASGHFRLVKKKE
jgi:hypothetical protein